LKNGDVWRETTCSGPTVNERYCDLTAISGGVAKRQLTPVADIRACARATPSNGSGWAGCGLSGSRCAAVQSGHPIKILPSDIERCSGPALQFGETSAAFLCQIEPAQDAEPLAKIVISHAITGRQRVVERLDH
jgi:hypothetical protein